MKCGYENSHIMGVGWCKALGSRPQTDDHKASPCCSPSSMGTCLDHCCDVCCQGCVGCCDCLCPRDCLYTFCFAYACYCFTGQTPQPAESHQYSAVQEKGSRDHFKEDRRRTRPGPKSYTAMESDYVNKEVYAENMKNSPYIYQEEVKVQRVENVKTNQPEPHRLGRRHVRHVPAHFYLVLDPYLSVDFSSHLEESQQEI
ncbi:hypothetical protein AALO_G00081440 [Alosa alosa]|uniref:Uncharacterized protein n=1 Tax=Alosa alosa TaxID=278164 RepID=A0AAV6GZG0_9TELE|nr:hypothetical protein AALO_G00081440 [Alosa alosa]